MYIGNLSYFYVGIDNTIHFLSQFIFIDLIKQNNYFASEALEKRKKRKMRYELFDSQFSIKK